MEVFFDQWIEKDDHSSSDMGRVVLLCGCCHCSSQANDYSLNDLVQPLCTHLHTRMRSPLFPGEGGSRGKGVVDVPVFSCSPLPLFLLGFLPLFCEGSPPLPGGDEDAPPSPPVPAASGLARFAE